MSDWTPARIEHLTRMWGAGCTASTIAAELGGGISRNAVIGKAARLGLLGRPSPIKTADPELTAEKRRAALQKPHRPKDPAAVRRSLIAAQTTANQRMAKPITKPVQRPVARAASPFKTCQYLHGEATLRNFCGGATKPGSSYCPKHHYDCHEKRKPEAAKSEAA